jgi:hypothetical protein
MTGRRKINISCITAVIRVVQWNLSNPDTTETQLWWPDYQGVLFSGVIDIAWVWLSVM